MSILKLLLAQLLTTVMILAGLLMPFHYDWSDYVHTDYGFPFLWATHTESTIAGPADIWHVTPTNLVANIVMWTVSSLALVALIRILSRKHA